MTPSPSDWTRVDEVLDALQKVCRELNVGIIHTKDHIEICENDDDGSLICKVLYITPGRKGYSK